MADGKKIFRFCLHFFYFNLSSPSGIATCTALLCMQFGDSAGNIAAGARIKANTFYYCIFFCFQREA
jgi:hypothetical protein